MSIIHRADQKKRSEQSGNGVKKQNLLGTRLRRSRIADFFNGLKAYKVLSALNRYRRGILLIILIALAGYYVMLKWPLWFNMGQQSQQKNQAQQHGIRVTKKPNKPAVQKQAASAQSVLNLDQLVQTQHPSHLQQMSFKRQNNALYITLQFDKLPFYQIRQQNNEMILIMADSKQARDMKSVKDADKGMVEAINFDQMGSKLKLRFQIADNIRLQHINSSKRQVTLVLGSDKADTNKIAGRKEAKTGTDAGEGTVKKVKHKKSPRERAAEYINEAKSEFRNNDYMNAQRSLKQALALEPDNLDALQLLATIYIEKGQTHQAMGLIQRGLKQSNQAPQFVMLKAYVLVAEHQISEAAEVLNNNRPLKMEDNLNYYALLANLQLRLQHFGLAVDLYKNLLEYDSGAGRWWIGLGIAQEHLGNHNQAQEAYDQALKDPDLPPGLRSFASVRAKQNQ